MQQGKNYALRLEIRTVSAEILIEGKQYLVDIIKDQLQKRIGPLRVTKKGELTVQEKVQFKIPGGQLGRQSICLLQLIDADGTKECGRFEFLILNYKNYSKNSFKMMDGEQTMGTIYMSINISSVQARRNSQRMSGKSSRKQKKVVIQQPEIRISNSSQQEAPPPSVNIKAPIEQIKLICPSQAAQQAKSMFNAFDNSDIVIITKREVQEEKKPKVKALSSMGELFQKKIPKEEPSLKVPNQNLIKSCRLSPSRLQNDSRYCKEIQQNLDNLSALDQQSNRLSCSRSPLKAEEEFSIFDTLHRMKDKFQKIHEHQGFLNDQHLDQLTEVNEEQTQQRDKLAASDQKDTFNQYANNEIKRVRSECQPLIHLRKSTIINLELNSHISESDSGTLPQYRITKTVDLCLLPNRPSLRIIPCDILQYPFNCSQVQESSREISTNKRYKLAVTSNISAFQQKEQTEAIRQPPTLNQSYLNFQIEQQSLEKISYIKLNKISHLSRAADISKRRNNFLIKANEQLKMAQRLAQQRLQISKKIISEKEDLLTHQFDGLSEHMRIISTNLSLKNQQSLKREQKVKSLQAMVQQYARDINRLKQDQKIKNAMIKDLKYLLSIKEQAQSKEMSKREDFGTNKSLREAMLEELLMSKNLIDFVKQGKKEELSVSKQFKQFPLPPKKEQPPSRGELNLFAEIFQSEQRNNSTSRTFLNQPKKIRQYNSIDNTVANIQVDQSERSVDNSNRTYRKFSHHKNSSTIIGSKLQKQVGRKSTDMDLVFEKLNCLIGGDSKGRILKNL